MNLGGHIATASIPASEDFASPSGPRSPLRPSASPAVNGFASRSFAPLAVRPPVLGNQQSNIKHVILPFLALVLLTVLSSLPVLAQSNPTEYDVKAAYLYNFGKFVKWPESATKGPNFLICVIGEDPFRGALTATVTGEKVNGKPATVVHLDSSRGASDCNILFISRSERYRVRRELESIDAAGTLTVSDIPGFTDDGGMIEFVNQSGRIRFDINLAAAQQAGLNLSSELLKVASAVKGKP